MEVRLTTTLQPPWAVQDATATIVKFQFAEHDAAARRHARDSAVLENLQPEILLDQLPVAVLLKLHECEHVFLQPQPCSTCQRFTEGCAGCAAEWQKLEGVFALQPGSQDMEV